MVSKLEPKRHMNIMEFSSKFWKWACLIIFVLGIATTLGIGLREHKTIRAFEKERVELQDSIISLREDIVAKEEAALAAEQNLQEANLNHQLEVAKIQGELNWARKHYSETLAELGSLDTSELKTYFAERYGQCADTVADSARFTLTVDAGNHIRYDLTDLDFCKEESGLKDSLIAEQTRFIGTLDTAARTLSAEKGYWMNKAESFEQQFNTSEQAKANVQASLEKQQTLSFILGGTAAVLAVGLISSLIFGGK